MRGILTTAIVTATVYLFTCFKYSLCKQCDCSCASRNDDPINLTVSGVFCKSDSPTFLDEGSIEKCLPQPQSQCTKIWRLATKTTICICETITENTLCQCRDQSSGNAPEVECSCRNSTTNIPRSTLNTLSTPTMEAKITADITGPFSTILYDRSNTTTKAPMVPMPRSYNPIGLGLGLSFGIIAIITMVFALMFLYRRYKEGSENQRKTPEGPVYASTLEGESRPTWPTNEDSLDNPTYGSEPKRPPLASQQDLSQDSSTHYTPLQLDRGRTNGGYSSSDGYNKRGGQKSLDTDDEHEYQGLYTEVPSHPSLNRLAQTDSHPSLNRLAQTEIGGNISGSSSYVDSLGDSRGDSLQRGLKLSQADDTDSSEPYYIKLNRDDFSGDSPCIDIPIRKLGIYNGSTSGDDTSDYEHLNFNREDILARAQERHEEEEEEEDEAGCYGIMVMGDRLGDANEEDYDHLDRGPPSVVGTIERRPVG